MTRLWTNVSVSAKMRTPQRNRQSKPIRTYSRTRVDSPTSAQPIAFASYLIARRYFRNLIGKGVHRGFGISGVEFCDGHHTRLPLRFIALPPVFGPLLRSLLPSHLHQSFDEQNITGETIPGVLPRPRRGPRS